MDDLSQAREDFIERFGLAFEADRMPRTAGRLMALLLLEGGPLGFEEISKALQVSRGSISTNTRILEAIKVIERVTKPGDRRDYFRIAERPGSFILESALERLATTRSAVHTMRQALGKKEPEAQRRLKTMEAFYDATAQGLLSALSSLEKPAP